jgi:hypothetical protein
MHAQAWSGILDNSRAVDWTPTGNLSIPNYTGNCSVQPTLQTGSGNAAANTTAIQNALASCDATHNVVNVPAGTYYVNGWKYGTQGNQVVRGAGPNNTYVFVTGYNAGVSGQCNNTNICMANQFPGDASSGSSQPGGSEACSWSGTVEGGTGVFPKGATHLTLTNCGSAPPLNGFIILDQADDSSDSGGIFLCTGNDGQPADFCQNEGSGNQIGRILGGKEYAEQQTTRVVAVSGSGSGPYTVTISPGIYFNNMRSSQTPGAWWNAAAPGQSNGVVTNEGLENLTIDMSASTSLGNGLTISNCIGCWVKNTRWIKPKTASVRLLMTMHTIVRDSYFYQSQTSGSQSYVVESLASSESLIENNIFQQVTNPLMLQSNSGLVISYNFSIANDSAGYFMQGSYASHTGGSGMNLFEGNTFNMIQCDDSWGTSTTGTLFRNTLPGWQAVGFNTTWSNKTNPIELDAFCRGYNILGNVLGEASPAFSHAFYQAYPGLASGGSNGDNTCIHTIYTLGFPDTSTTCSNSTPPNMDPAVMGTLMRWGNYDVVTGAVKWDTTEAQPKAVSYINTNTLANPSSHTLPASLYYSARPLWWSGSKAWPLSGPGVTGGNLLFCTSGTYSGSQVASSSQCAGGSSASAYAGLANSNPAMDCYLNTMVGPPDGSGGVLKFDASACYSGTVSHPPASPTGLTAVVH